MFKVQKQLLCVHARLRIVKKEAPHRQTTTRNSLNACHVLECAGEISKSEPSPGEAP
jgi:hypothetical protein